MRFHARPQPLSALRVAVVSLLVLVAFPAAASAAQYTVNDDSAAGGPPGSDCLSPDYPSINAALADPVVVDGDTLFVCTGAYTDTTVSKQVILLGAQAGNDARARTFSILNESIVSGGFIVPASNVTINGFTAQDASPAIGAGINVAGSTGHTFVNRPQQNPGPLPTAHCPLPTAHCPLSTAHCPLPTAHCPLPTVPPRRARSASVQSHKAFLSSSDSIAVR